MPAEDLHVVIGVLDSKNQKESPSDCFKGVICSVLSMELGCGSCVDHGEKEYNVVCYGCNNSTWNIRAGSQLNECFPVVLLLSHLSREWFRPLYVPRTYYRTHGVWFFFGSGETLEIFTDRPEVDRNHGTTEACVLRHFSVDLSNVCRFADSRFQIHRYLGPVKTFYDSGVINNTTPCG